MRGIIRLRPLHAVIHISESHGIVYDLNLAIAWPFGRPVLEIYHPLLNALGVLSLADSSRDLSFTHLKIEEVR